MQLYNTPPRQSFVPLAIPDDVPVYRINEEKFFADDELYEAGSIIVWPDEPNKAMKPLNDLARKEFKKFVEKLDKCGREVSEKAGKAYVPELVLETAYELAHQDSRRVQLLNGTQEVPIMGGKRKSRARKVEIEEVDPMIENNNKHSLNTAKAVNGAKP